METIQAAVETFGSRANGWFEITDEQLAILKDKVVVLTGS